MDADVTQTNMILTEVTRQYEADVYAQKTRMRRLAAIRRWLRRFSATNKAA